MKNRIARKIVKRKNDYTARGRLDLVRKAIRTTGPERRIYVKRRPMRRNMLTLEQLQERLKQGPVKVRYHYSNTGKMFYWRWTVEFLSQSTYGLKAYGESFHTPSYGPPWTKKGDSFYLSDCCLIPYDHTHGRTSGYWNASNWLEFDE